MPLVSPSLMEPIKHSAASGSTITAGAGMTLAGSTLGIDPTAVVHVAGISADGGMLLLVVDLLIMVVWFRVQAM
jgi:hypothetical protein